MFLGVTGKPLQQWKVFPLPLDNLDLLRFDSSGSSGRAAPLSLPPSSGPTFYRLHMHTMFQGIVLLPQGLACTSLPLKPN